MWHCSNEHQRPSFTIESTIWRVSHAQPLARSRQQVRRVAHRLHPAGDGDLDIARRDGLLREHHSLQPGAAHLVDGQRRDVVGKAAAQRGLSGRRLADAGRDDVAHDAFLDARRVDAGAAHRFANHEGAKVGGGEVLQRAEKLAGGCANGGNDDGVLHVVDRNPRRRRVRLQPDLDLLTESR